jgi:hypothetical protein
MNKNTYKVTDNLYVEGDSVISYETVVARIEGGTLVELGKFSRTTSKHISKVAKLMGKKIIAADKKTKPDFYKFEMGVRTAYDNCISQKASLLILESIGKNIPYDVTLATLKGKIPKKDWNLLDKEGIDEKLLKGGSLLSRVGIY